MKMVAQMAVSRVMKLPAPRPPKTCAVAPLSAPRPPPLPCWSRTTRIRNTHTSTWMTLTNVWSIGVFRRRGAGLLPLFGPRGQSLSGFDDLPEPARIHGCAADERAVDVGLIEEALGVVGLDAAAVEDARLLRELFRGLGEDAADHGVDGLRVRGRGHEAGADGPDGLVGDDAEARLPGELVDDGAHLALDDLERGLGV